jgi:hypothetical protein
MTTAERRPTLEQFIKDIPETLSKVVNHRTVRAAETS